MQKRLFHLAVYLFFCTNAAVAQTYPSLSNSDSLLFENLFSGYQIIKKEKSSVAIDSLEYIQSIAISKNYFPAINRYYLEKASWFLSNKNNDSAVIYYEAAIQLATKKNLEKELGISYLSLANFFQYNGNTLAAAKNYLLATKLLKDQGRKRALVGLYRNLLTVLIRVKQKNSTLENMLAATITDQADEEGLVKIINTRNSEEQGFNFPDQSLVKEVGADGIHVIFGNAKFPVDFKTLGSYGSFRDIQRIPSGALSLIPDFPRNGSILMEFSGNPKVYIAKDRHLYHITSPEILEYYGGWDAVYYVPDGSLKKFPKAAQLVTADNVNTIFNLSQAFDILTDSIEDALKQNRLLSNKLTQTVRDRNNALQKRKTWLWALAVGVAALLAIVVLMVRNSRQKQKINKQSLQNLRAEQIMQRKMELEKERTRIATDMHDDLGAGLSTIRFLSEKVKRNSFSDSTRKDAEKIVDNSNELQQKMNELIWAMNEKNDTLEDLLFYTRSYAADYCEMNNLQIHITMPENIPNLIVNGELRRNVFLCVKESLHNIVKHAAAKNVTLQFNTGNTLNILIADDGKGFATEGKAMGNGLRNMKMRMEMLGGELEVQNENGISITLKVTLPSV